MIDIPFNKPYLSGREMGYIQEAHALGHLAGNGTFTRRCHQWLEARYPGARAFLTHSGTGALEMAALLLRVGPGDEVILPSYTFVTTASAFVLRGAVPVFVDIRPDTLNLDENRLVEAITSKTRGIVPVHYAGVGCEMTPILGIAASRGLWVCEDAAQGVGATYQGRLLGSFGRVAALSFHETKNIICGEGGALLVNDPALVPEVEMIWQKGTDRERFQRGEIQKYEWKVLGSSFIPSEIQAAFLMAQMEAADLITERRRGLWNTYHLGLEEMERRGYCRRPVIPPNQVHNAHMYHLLLPDSARRDRVMEKLGDKGIQSVFHYIPLHLSQAGLRYGRASGTLPVTIDVASRLLRLPLWLGLERHQERVLETLYAVLTD